jgi:GNAT superfamily N-acetyltransferase
MMPLDTVDTSDNIAETLPHRDGAATYRKRGKMRVRPIEAKDGTRVTLLAEELHKFSKFSDLPFDHVKVATMFSAAIANPDKYFAWVVEDEFGMVVGGMLGEMAEMYFSDVKFAFEYAVYITPDARGTYAGRRLISQFIDWAQEHGAVEVHFGVIAGINDELSRLIYEKIGLEDMGRLYRKVLNNG